ncbi:MAG TPA: hypothetical protein VK935_09470 [Actinomycetospora sp.]|nr:hypothetical protein [Actinomycetospora sp.]
MTPLAVWWTLLPLSAPGPPPGAPPGSERGEEFGKTSPIALVVILLLGLATVLLIRSMSKRLRNVPASFDPPSGAAEDGDGGGHGVAGADGVDGVDTADRPSATPSGRNGLDRPEGPPGTGSP